MKRKKFMQRHPFIHGLDDARAWIDEIDYRNEKAVRVFWTVATVVFSLAAVALAAAHIDLYRLERRVEALEAREGE